MPFLKLSQAILMPPAPVAPKAMLPPSRVLAAQELEAIAWPAPKRTSVREPITIYFAPSRRNRDVGLAGPELKRAFVPALGLLVVRSDASEVGFLEFGGIVGGPQGHCRF